MTDPTRWLRDREHTPKDAWSAEDRRTLRALAPQHPLAARLLAAHRAEDRDPALPADPRTWLDWHARHTTPATLTPGAVTVLERLAAEYTTARRLLDQYRKHVYDTAKAIPSENPFQHGDLLEAYRRWRTRTWPAPRSAGQPGGYRSMSFKRGTPCTGQMFFDLIDPSMFTRAYRWSVLGKPANRAAWDSLTWGTTDEGRLTYKVGQPGPFGRALEDLRAELWSVVRFEGYAYEDRP